VFGALRDAVAQRVACNSGVLIECQTRMLLGEYQRQTDTTTETGSAVGVSDTAAAVIVSDRPVPSTPADHAACISGAAALASATAVASERVVINMPDREQQRRQDADSTPEPHEVPIQPPAGIGVDSEYVGGEVPAEGEPNV
jgi:hypothetical protein